MKYFLHILFYIFLIVLQFTLLPRLMMNGFVPDLLLCFTIIISLYFGVEWGCLIGLISGILIDSHTSILLGARGFLYVQIALVVAIFSDRILYETLSAQIIIIALCAFIGGMLQILVTMIFTFQQGFLSVFSGVLIQVISTIIFAFPMIWMMKRIRLVPSMHHD